MVDQLFTDNNLMRVTLSWRRPPSYRDQSIWFAEQIKFLLSWYEMWEGNESNMRRKNNHEVRSLAKNLTANNCEDKKLTNDDWSSLILPLACPFLSKQKTRLGLQLVLFRSLSAMCVLPRFQLAGRSKWLYVRWIN